MYYHESGLNGTNPHMTCYYEHYRSYSRLKSRVERARVNSEKETKKKNKRLMKVGVFDVQQTSLLLQIVCRACYLCFDEGKKKSLTES